MSHGQPARILGRARLRVHLRHALFGRIEGIDRERLRAETLAGALGRVIEQLHAYLGSEQIELGGD
jgi:hypothetical protein